MLYTLFHSPSVHKTAWAHCLSAESKRTCHCESTTEYGEQHLEKPGSHNHTEKPFTIGLVSVSLRVMQQRCWQVLCYEKAELQTQQNESLSSISNAWRYVINTVHAPTHLRVRDRLRNACVRTHLRCRSTCWIPKVGGRSMRAYRHSTPTTHVLIRCRGVDASMNCW